jgi:ABC-2 type transport system permease protein
MAPGWRCPDWGRTVPMAPMAPGWRCRPWWCRTVLMVRAGLVSSGVAVAVTAAWWAAKGGALHLSAAGTWLTLGGGAAANVAFAVIGVGVGALIRNLVAAVAAALAWIALIEGIAGQLAGSGLARWLPLRASEALDRSSLLGATRLLPQWAGGLVLLGYAAVFAGAAALTTLRRDVT